MTLQDVRCAIGVGRANPSNLNPYHAARRARSRAGFIAKLGVAAEEADETEHWLIVITKSQIVTSPPLLNEVPWLLDEARQLRAILVQSVRTARANYRKSLK